MWLRWTRSDGRRAQRREPDRGRTRPDRGAASAGAAAPRRLIAVRRWSRPTVVVRASPRRPWPRPARPPQASAGHVARWVAIWCRPAAAPRRPPAGPTGSHRRSARRGQPAEAAGAPAGGRIGAPGPEIQVRFRLPPPRRRVTPGRSYLTRYKPNEAPPRTVEFGG